MDIAVPEPFDVNGYYREIGVSPKATKAEIRDAILALPPSYRVAAIARLLLNRKRRAAYDAAPFGSVYVDELFTENLARMSLRHLDRHVRQVEDGALGWGHYLCGSGRSDYPSMWRALLLEALRGRSVTSISLGWQGPLSQELFRVVMVEGHPIVLIRETDEPTAEQAEAIAAQLIVPPLHPT